MVFPVVLRGFSFGFTNRQGFTRVTRAGVTKCAGVTGERIARRVHKRLKAYSRWVRHELLYWAAIMLLWVPRLLPRGPGLALCGLLGSVAFLFPNREKRRTLEHLRMIYGDRWSERRIRSTAHAVYRNIAKNMFDAFCLSRLGREELERLVQADDLARLREVYQRGAGVVMVAAHLGCFELLLYFMGRVGFKAFAVGRKLQDPRLDELVRNLRSGPNVQYVYRSDSPRAILRLLREGRLMGVLIDQDTRGVDGVFAHFFGRLAYTPSGIIKMAMRFDIPVFVVTTARQPDGTHRIFLSEQIALLKDGDPDAALVRNIEHINSVITGMIEPYPEQWVWMHQRWRRRPTDRGLEEVPNIERLAGEGGGEHAASG
jgi:KDO2-lipid IV(A) lauroyltransferase